MANGRSSAVRSHRRAGSKGKVALWIAIPLVVVVAGVGVTYGYQWVSKQVCSGSVSANVIAPPQTANLLRDLAGRWEKTNPQIGGTCAKVEVREQESAVTAEALSKPWDPGAEVPAPDVWVPSSTAWARAAAANSDFADHLLPDKLPSVARTPVVIAMPKEIAESLGWPNAELDWAGVLDKLGADVKLGISNPATSTAGLLALSSIIDADDNTDVDPDEIKRVFALEQRVAFRADSTAELFAEYAKSKGQTIQAFPTLEQDLLKYNQANKDLPLVAVYPQNATTEADNPFLRLSQAEWTSAQRQAAAGSFLEFVRSQAGRDAVMAEGYRDSNRRGGAQLNSANGISATLTALPRAVLLGDSVASTVKTWTALTKPKNIMLVLDVSGSMGSSVPGTGQSRLDLTKAAAAQAVGMFGDDTQFGLWVFSSKQQGTAPYKEVVKPGKLGEQLNGTERRTRLTDELKKLEPGGNTGMYDSVWAAYQAVQANYVQGAENVVVLLTDGADDDQGKGLSLDQLTEKLRAADPAKPVKVIPIALGKDTNSDALAQIATATKVQTYSSQKSYDIAKVLINAILPL